MNITVKCGLSTPTKAVKVRLPDRLVVGQPLVATVNGVDLSLLWNKESRTLVITDQAGLERCLLVRASQVRTREGGDFQVEAEVGVTGDHSSFTIEHLIASIDYDIPGQGHRQAGKTSKGLILRSQITGKILKILVTVGQTVQAGDALLVIEAMKMENRIFASQGGIIGNLAVKEGESVATGRELLRIEAP